MSVEQMIQRMAEIDHQLRVSHIEVQEHKTNNEWLSDIIEELRNENN